MRRIAALGAGLLLLAACADDSPVGPGQGRTASRAEAEQALAAGAHRITVLNFNVYPGANLDLVIEALASADPTDDLPALLFAIETLQRTDATARLAGLADQIARHRPHVVGLNEIDKIDVDLTVIGLPIVVHEDFLASLQAALADRGLDYVVAAKVQNITALPFPFLSFVDYDVMLADASRVSVGAKVERNFTLNLGVVATNVEIKRGWVGIEAAIDGREYTFVSAHPESGDPWAALRAAQATELVGSLGNASPVILMGDLNDVPGSPLYQVVQGAGFSDLWRALRPGATGYTCCHVDDLSEPVAKFEKRIDYAFARGVGHGNRPALGQITRFNLQPSDRIEGPEGLLWLSDHAGLVASLLFPRGGEGF